MSIKQPTATTDADVPGTVKAITDHEFGLFQKLIYRQAGIQLTGQKKALLEARLTRRLKELNLGSFTAYYRHLINDIHGAEMVQMLDRIATNETHFFREPKQFEFLQQQILPRWLAEAASGLRPRRIRVWSAGCSTGEEAYSLGMVLSEGLPPLDGWQIEIFASDISSKVLSSASRGVWPIEKAAEIPDHLLKRHMLKGFGNQAGKMKAGEELRRLIHFERLNLNDDFYPLRGHFDLIFCRNVLIYFDLDSKTRVIHRLLDHLMPDGYLFVGHAESLTSVTERATYVMPTIYVLRRDSIVHQHPADERLTSDQ